MGPLSLLLDTCTFVWLTAAPAELSPTVTAALSDAPSERVYLSDVSAWEITLKWEAGKLHLPRPPRLWLEQQIKTWRFRLLPLARPHFYRASELPLHHRDPFDRLLVAQAIEQGLTLATPDQAIARYPVATLW